MPVNLYEVYSSHRALGHNQRTYSRWHLFAQSEDLIEAWFGESNYHIDLIRPLNSACSINSSLENSLVTTLAWQAPDTPTTKDHNNKVWYICWLDLTEEQYQAELRTKKPPEPEQPIPRRRLELQ